MKIQQKRNERLLKKKSTINKKDCLLEIRSWSKKAIKETSGHALWHAARENIGLKYLGVSHSDRYSDKHSQSWVEAKNSHASYLDAVWSTILYLLKSTIYLGFFFSLAKAMFSKYAVRSMQLQFYFCLLFLGSPSTPTCLYLTLWSTSSFATDFMSSFASFLWSSSRPSFSSSNLTFLNLQWICPSNLNLVSFIVFFLFLHLHCPVLWIMPCLCLVGLTFSSYA